MIQGAVAIVCLAGGQWNGSVPSCVSHESIIPNNKYKQDPWTIHWCCNFYHAICHADTVSEL